MAEPNEKDGLLNFKEDLTSHDEDFNFSTDLSPDEKLQLRDLKAPSNYQDDFSTIAWDQDEQSERQRRGEIYKKVPISLNSSIVPVLTTELEGYSCKIAECIVCLAGLVGCLLRWRECCCFLHDLRYWQRMGRRFQKWSVHSSILALSHTLLLGHQYVCSTDW